MLEKTLKNSICDMRDCIAEYGVSGKPVTINTCAGPVLDENGGVSVFLKKTSGFFGAVSGYIMTVEGNVDQGPIRTEELLDILDGFIDEHGNCDLVVHWYPDVRSRNHVTLLDNGAAQPFCADQSRCNAFFIDCGTDYVDSEHHARARQNAMFGGGF